MQPVAADTVAEALVETALAQKQDPTRMITGPEAIRLPELTTRLLARLGDARPVRAVPPRLSALAEGVLLAPEQAEPLRPDMETWLSTHGPSA